MWHSMMKKTFHSKEREVNEEEDAQLAADWEDVGGSELTPEELERIAIDNFGCPEV